jgi:8-amino-7-oxononanoate synthase
MLKYLETQLAERESQSLRRHRRTAETACAPRQTVTTRDEVPRELLAFCSNDYLGLANHPLLIEALGEGAQRYGAGSGASHLISGHSRAHALLEEDLAEMLSPHVPEARALTFCTGYMANMALLTALGDAHEGDRRRRYLLLRVLSSEGPRR